MVPNKNRAQKQNDSTDQPIENNVPLDDILDDSGIADNSLCETFNMPRHYIRKTNRGFTAELIKAAADEVIIENKSVRSTAKKYNLCHVSLSRYVAKFKTSMNNDEVSIPNVGYKGPKPIQGLHPFSVDQEQILSQYIKNSADMYFGLTPRDIKQLAYQFAHKLGLKYPEVWGKNLMAGPDWFTKILKRNSSLSLRQPEATSLSRAMNFNKANVNLFMDKFQQVLLKYKFEAQHIYIIDETGVTTVQTPSKVVATKGKKQIGAITSAERGVLVTMCIAVNGTGCAIPPMFVFPRVKFHQNFLRGGPAGCVGTANKSGWMQGPEFLTFMEHFLNHVRPSLEKKVLVLLDNHESHLYLPVIDFCKDNGIVLLSFPPHCSHKLQPLDRSVYGPFKKFVNREMDQWMTMHPGSRMTIYDIPQIVAGALPDAVSPRNIMGGFKVSGIWPFDRNIFREDEFAPSLVTDVDDLETNQINQDTHPEKELFNSLEPELRISPNQIDVSSNVAIQVSNDNCSNSTILNQTLADNPIPSTSSNVISPESIRPYPKAVREQKLNKKGRQKGKSAVLTDTPEKNEIEKKFKAKAVKRNIFEQNKNRKPKL
ncbi:hypothetical protein AGLY_018080 [Aphis glycines]|uniref:DDE-1 domain-containing protein n=1 Tax=Aphis glycines TaxID=307491 RepID=A0A6G0SU82_APHGL|nr:hypothetical protein AGLY_018080 [Aphis glycines]